MVEPILPMLFIYRPESVDRKVAASSTSSFCRFVTEPSQLEDGPPEWPKGADYRIVGIACPSCGHESRDPVHRNAGSFLRSVTCTACGWSGRVPL